MDSLQSEIRIQFHIHKRVHTKCQEVGDSSGIKIANKFKAFKKTTRHRLMFGAYLNSYTSPPKNRHNALHYSP
jgi:hypothetical protein